MAHISSEQMIVLIVLQLLFQLYVVDSETTGKLNGDLRIVGGTDAFAFPTLAFSAGSKLCGATLIYSDVLLTAAHCAGVFIENGIFLGGNTADGTGSLYFGVTKEFPHPGYDTISDSNDIMLVKLNTPSTVSPIKINFDPQFPSDGVESKVIGYGATSEGGSSSFFLQEVSIPIVPYSQCDSFWNKLEATTQICTGLPDGIKDSCQGDSGGPLLVNNIQVGIVSFGLGCARANTPSVYTRVSGYQEFIESGICDLSSNPPVSCKGLAPLSAPAAIPTAIPLRIPTTASTSMPSKAPLDAPISVPLTTAVPVDTITALPVGNSTNAPVTMPTEAPVDAPINVPLLTAAPVDFPVAVLSSAPMGAPNTSPSIAPKLAPVDNPTIDRTNSPTQVPIASPNSSPVTTTTFAPADSAVPAPGGTISNMPVASPNASPLVVSTLAPVAIATPKPTKVPIRVPIGVPSTRPIVVPLDNPVNQPLSTPIRSPIAAPGAAQSEAPVDASNRSSSPVVLPVLTPSSAPKVTPTISPAISPRTTPVTRPSPVTPIVSPIVTPTSGQAASPVVVPSKGVPVSSPKSTPILYSPALSPVLRPVIVAAPPIVEKKGMTMKKGMGDSFNDDAFPVLAPSDINKGMKKQKGMGDSFNDDAFPVLAPSDINKGMKKQKGQMRMKVMGGQKSTDDEIDIMVFLKLNPTLNPAGMNSVVKGKQGSNAIGAMMMSDISTVPPRAMRMSRIGKNSTSPFKAFQSIVHAFHHGNASVHDIDNNTVPINSMEKNSTIGSLLERFRKNINQGLHFGSNNTASNNSFAHSSNIDTDGNQSKFPRLSALWDKIVDRFGLEKDTNHTTTMVGSTIREWFYGKY